FESCPSLRGIFFKGNAPAVGASAFLGDDQATVYYLPGRVGWNLWASPPPAVLWNPQPQSPIVQANQLGFTITGTTNIPMVVEACTDLAGPAWLALQTCTLTNGSIYFSDPDWTNHPTRFYRIRSP
ncbi:MAG: hypothetical protein WCM93_17255, partial [Bacteroidota bacterium]